ncbi:AAA family ATPase [Lysobacter sp. S4-A87]|uniref:AAA family ATPase n=1 Tax=Lysobacter sp. S4-A87 TaxID=2925843 RepID=UPI001F536BE2|nr:AAA family ATPase [Lysobacter sp. S4-A87]UNK49262.1 AAA family ATPase [Lysobacter sp. S4-A87]
MYLEHYGLTEPPFSITPDPRFVFLSERHRDALAHLLFGVDQGGGGGFVQLTGEVGTGKTTLCRLLLEQIPETTRVALVLNPRLTPVELLETICEELHLDLDSIRAQGNRGSLKALVDALNAYLLDAYAQGLRVVLIIDEAQNLSVDALEQVRLLTNLETPTQKLLQIVLLAQPELRTILARDDLRQLAQRITARYHLTPLDAAETGEYLRHRFRVAGGQHFPFNAGAVKRIHAHAGGVPRLINNIAERSLLAGYAHDASQIDARKVDLAAAEVLPGQARRWWPAKALVTIPLAVVAIALLALAATLWWPRAPAMAPATASTPAPSEVALKPAPATAQPALDAVAFAARLRTTAPSPALAWGQLLARWQLPAGANEIAAAAACPPMLATDVYCLRGRASLDALIAQDRPVLLLLKHDGASTWSTLEGADARQVRLRMGNDLVAIDRIALQQFWDGEHAALWRAPAFLADTPRLGGQGAATDWVRARLQPRYLPAQAGAATFDIAMQEAVRRFQRDHGLASDGLVGPATLLALAATGTDGPRLQTPGK